MCKVKYPRVRAKDIFLKPHPDILAADCELLRMGEITHERYTARFMDVSKISEHERALLCKHHPQKELMVMTLLSSPSSSPEGELPIFSHEQPNLGHVGSDSSDSTIFHSQQLDLHQVTTQKYASMNNVVSITALHPGKRLSTGTEKGPTSEMAAKKSKDNFNA
jgi:hypothetical protein